VVVDLYTHERTHTFGFPFGLPPTLHFSYCFSPWAAPHLILHTHTIHFSDVFPLGCSILHFSYCFPFGLPLTAYYTHTPVSYSFPSGLPQTRFFSYCFSLWAAPHCVLHTHTHAPFSYFFPFGLPHTQFFLLFFPCGLPPHTPYYTNTRSIFLLFSLLGRPTLNFSCCFSLWAAPTFHTTHTRAPFSYCFPFGLPHTPYYTHMHQFPIDFPLGCPTLPLSDCFSLWPGSHSTLAHARSIFLLFSLWAAPHFFFLIVFSFGLPHAPFFLLFFLLGCPTFHSTHTRAHFSYCFSFGLPHTPFS
jgi:hypothetical protein